MNMMKVEIVSSETIKPSTPTPAHLRTLELSLIDQLAPTFYVPVTLFYTNNTRNILNTPKIMSHLKKSLSETLTHFYPLAGRVRDFKHVDCNDQGVLYKEARANFHLSEFLENPNLDMLIKFVSHDTNSIDLDTPQIMVALQVTVFDCGGIVIGMSIFHRIVDAVTIIMFLNSWAETTRGGYDKVTHLDWSTASLLFPATDSLPTQFLTFFNRPPTPEPGYVVRRFVFDASAIANLKSKATCEAVPNPTRVEALTSFLCSRLILASKTLTGTFDMCIITHAVNIRPRLVPPLPKQTLRNLIWMVVSIFVPSDSDPQLHELVELVNEMFANLSGEVITSFQGEHGKEMIVDNSKELIDLVGNGKKIDILGFTSWCNMGFYEPDFGWGKPVWVGGALDGNGQNIKREVMFLETRSGDGIEMLITDTAQIIGLLENDLEFLAYATKNPAIPTH